MRKILLASVLSLTAASVASASTIYPLGMSSTAGFSAGSGVGQTPRGWDFVINQPITVEQLGINAGIATGVTMSLWDVTTQTLLGQTTVTSSPFAWVFADLPTAIGLTPGDTFSVTGWADTTVGAVPWYIFNNTPPAAFNPSGTVTYLNTRFDNDIGVGVFPTQTLPSPAQYGVADIGYSLSSVPEPATLTLVGLGLVGLLRRKLIA
jgi:PEP-CTERM motif